ncbi:hypothetical protein PENSOL_c001G11803 [Penicillium solitum]|uniref:Amidohydrolase-related domain-containing protein n=1 Tax=Penicillium solitum TaxID=60172 RepID=A0A1V6RNR0_9EURO|nr:uncharacterized protein PENSOL_c001G11803 [Penicillium solitum]OQE03256.1 hypothetical protein PENSOL_c001G11803 [Penicillium solitum]
MTPTQIPIVDSHIHLFPATHLKTLSWHNANNPLGTQHSVNEYRHATTQSNTTTPLLRGFIFLETDRLSSITDSTPPNHGWQHALDEVSLLTRIALGTPIPGEGHVPQDKSLCLGIVPWAPVPGGPDVLSAYMEQPNLRLVDDVHSHPEFLEWKDLVTRMARANPRTYMKLSGSFSELLPLEAESEPDFGAIVELVQPWTDVVFDAFGADRVMFGSDWPVCNVGGGGNDVSWGRWRRVVEEILERRGLSEEQKRDVWGSVALHVYGIKI